jgi:hypothetical protein
MVDDVLIVRRRPTYEIPPNAQRKQQERGKQAPIIADARMALQPRALPSGVTPDES